MTMKKSKLYLEVAIEGKSRGKVTVELLPEISPKASKIFLALCCSKDDVKHKSDLCLSGAAFDLVHKGSFIQGGFSDASCSELRVSLNGDGGFSLNHGRKGVLSMADPGLNPRISKFLVTTGPCPQLDGKHCVFGRILSGFDVITSVENLPTDVDNKPTSKAVIVDCGEAENGECSKNKSVTDPEFSGLPLFRETPNSVEKENSLLSSSESNKGFLINTEDPAILSLPDSSPSLNELSLIRSSKEVIDSWSKLPNFAENAKKPASPKLAEARPSRSLSSSSLASMAAERSSKGAVQLSAQMRVKSQPLISKGRPESTDHKSQSGSPKSTSSFERKASSASRIISRPRVKSQPLNSEGAPTALEQRQRSHSPRSAAMADKSAPAKNSRSFELAKPAMTSPDPARPTGSAKSSSVSDTQQRFSQSRGSSGKVLKSEPGKKTENAAKPKQERAKISFEDVKVDETPKNLVTKSTLLSSPKQKSEERKKKAAGSPKLTVRKEFVVRKSQGDNVQSFSQKRSSSFDSRASLSLSVGSPPSLKGKAEASVKTAAASVNLPGDGFCDIGTQSKDDKGDTMAASMDVLEEAEVSQVSKGQSGSPTEDPKEAEALPPAAPPTAQETPPAAMPEIIQPLPEIPAEVQETSPEPITAQGSETEQQAEENPLSMKEKLAPGKGNLARVSEIEEEPSSRPERSQGADRPALESRLFQRKVLERAILNRPMGSRQSGGPSLNPKNSLPDAEWDKKSGSQGDVTKLSDISTPSTMLSQAVASKEAMDTIVFCNSIVHDVIYMAANRAEEERLARQRETTAAKAQPNCGCCIL